MCFYFSDDVNDENPFLIRYCVHIMQPIRVIQAKSNG